MAKRRMITIETWEDSHIASLSVRQRLLWIGLITTADDQGRGHAHPGLVHAHIFPFDNLDNELIEQDLVAIAALGVITLYEDEEGTPLYQINRWWEHQQLRWAWPSQLAAPPGWVDREHYRRGNQVLERNWEHTGGFESGDAPPVAEDEVAVPRPATPPDIENEVAAPPPDAPPDAEDEVAVPPPDAPPDAEDEITAPPPLTPPGAPEELASPAPESRQPTVAPRRDHSGPTVAPRRDHSGPTLVPAPSGSGSISTNDSINDSVSESVSESGKGAVRSLTGPPASAPTRPPAVIIYQDIVGCLPNRALWDGIHTAVGTKVTDLAFWGQVIKNWIATGYSEKNLKGMLEHFARRELPSTQRHRYRAPPLDAQAGAAPTYTGAEAERVRRMLNRHRKANLDGAEGDPPSESTTDS